MHATPWTPAASVVLLACPALAQDCLSWRVMGGAPLAPAARVSYGFAFDEHRAVTVLYGGTLSDSGRPGEQDTWEWDGAEWRLLAAPGPGPRYRASLTYDPVNRRCLLFGGQASPRQLVGELWSWDGAAWRRIAARGPSPRTLHGACFDRDRGVLIVQGGYTDAGGSAETWEFDGSAWTLRANSGPPAAGIMAMAYDEARHVTVLHRSDRFSGEWDTQEWDGTRWTLRASGGGTYSVAGQLAYDPGPGRVLLVDGYGGTWAWEGARWSLVGSAPFRPRDRAGLAFDRARGKALVFSGAWGSDSVGGDLWGWNGAVWRHEPGCLLRARSNAAMCFDATRGVTVLFGGGEVDASNETWEWDGARWFIRSLEPPPRIRRHALAHDSARGVSVLFGGVTDPGPVPPLGQTWEYDGAVWLRRDVPGPAGRYGHAMTYDERRREIVLFGGNGPYPTVFGDTWAWDGAAWRERPVPGPSPRQGHSMAYDRGRGVVVLFGGDSLQDTWEWDGQRWQERPGVAPGAPSHAELYYDEAHGRIRLIGNPMFLGTGLEVWEWDGDFWAFVSAVGPPARYDYRVVYDAARLNTVLFGGSTVTGWPHESGYLALRSPLAFRRAPLSQRIDPGRTLNLYAEACGQGVSYQWRHNGVPLRDDGRITGSQTPALRVADVGPSDAGVYGVVASSPAGQVTSPGAEVELSGMQPCYADCDTSTGARVLDVFDFLCFQNAFAAMAPYACDCDTPGGGPNQCDIFDFLCFFDAFSEGCP